MERGNLLSTRQTAWVGVSLGVRGSIPGGENDIGGSGVSTSDQAASQIRSCRGCDGRDLRPVLNLGDQPPSDVFPLLDAPLPDPRWPLALVMCATCSLVQLDHNSPAPEEPLAVESETLRRHAVEVTRRVRERHMLPQGTTVREFASHHGGSWLASFAAHGLNPVEDDCALLVVDNHSLIHAEDLQGELTKRIAAMAPGGLFAIEFHHALAQLEEGQFDTARHGHPLYFSLTSWRNACRRFGLEVIDAWREPVFGGCLVAVATRTPAEPNQSVHDILHQESLAGADDPIRFAALDRIAKRAVGDFTAHLREAAAQGRRVLGYGAGSKAVTFLGVADVGPELLPCIADLAPGKTGRRIPGVAIPIISPTELVRLQPDEVIVLTWDIAAEVVKQLRNAGLRNTRFVVAMPQLQDIP